MVKIEIKFDFPVLIHNRHTAKIHGKELLLCTKTGLITMLSRYDFAHPHRK